MSASRRRPALLFLIALACTATLVALGLVPSSGPRALPRAALAAVSANPDAFSKSLWDHQDVAVLCPHGVIFDGPVGADGAGQEQTLYCNPFPPPTTTTTVPTTTVPPTTSTSTSTTSTTTTSSSTTTTTVPPSPSGVPASLLTDSVFNRPVTSDAVLSDSATLVASLVNQYETSYGEVGVNFNRPVFEAPAGTPDVSVSVASGCNNFLPSTGSEVPIPSYAFAGDSSDQILTVYSPSAGYVWEFWLASKTSSGWQACWGGKTPLSSTDGVFPSPYGETATGIENLATEVTEGDVYSGHIDHAIAIQIEGEYCNSDVPPADRGDCSGHPNNPSEGSWFRFSPSVDCADYAATPFESEVCVAGQTYGFVVVDQGGGVELEADEPSVWSAEGNSCVTSEESLLGPFGGVSRAVCSDPITVASDGLEGYQVVAHLPWSDLQAIAPPS